MIFTFRYHQESIVVLISCTKHFLFSYLPEAYNFAKHKEPLLFSNQSKIHMRANRAFPQ